MPDGWRADLDDDRSPELAASLARLQQIARQVVAASLDASMARIGAQRLADLASGG